MPQIIEPKTMNPKRIYQELAEVLCRHKKGQPRFRSVDQN